MKPESANLNRIRRKLFEIPAERLCEVADLTEMILREKDLQSVRGTEKLEYIADTVGITSPQKSDKTAEVCAEIPLISSAVSDTLKLGSIDVTVSTKEKYNKELSTRYNDREAHGRSAFFSSDSADMGYMDGNILDTIIGRFEK